MILSGRFGIAFGFDMVFTAAFTRVFFANKAFAGCSYSLVDAAAVRCAEAKSVVAG